MGAIVMSKIALNLSLVARDGTALRVLGIARISGGPGQTEKSNEDQEALYAEWIRNRTDLPFTLTVIAGEGSGEWLDREEIEQARKQLETGQYDLVIAEDLGRIMRRMHAFLFCEFCEDIGTRLVAINDNVDTADAHWRLNAFFATLRHELYNADTAKRIRRTQRNRFQNGGMVKIPIFCYLKPEVCNSDADLKKISEMEPVVLGIFERLESGWSYSRVADWLNKAQVPLGVGCRVKKWNGAMVRRIVYNPILKGLRVWNNHLTRRINRTGRRRQVLAPLDERLPRHVPHLAFIDADRYDLLISQLTERGERYSVPKRRGNDPRRGRSKKRSRWPGQQVFCGLPDCKEMYVYGGHGKKRCQMCSGAREYSCWNGVTFDADLAAKRISDVVFGFVQQLPDFDTTMLEVLKEEATYLQRSRRAALVKLENELDQLKREEDRMAEAIAKGAGLDILIAKLNSMQARRRSLEFEQRQLAKELPPPVSMPGIAEIKRQFEVSFTTLAVESDEFADQMKKVIKRIDVYPVRLLDGGNPVLRAKFEVNLACYLPEAMRLPALADPLRREFVVDLFEMPQRAQFRLEIIAARDCGETERSIASRLGLTITAVQRAAKLHRLMQAKELTDPYVEITAPIEGNKRYRRHLHDRFQQSSDAQGDAA
jgi:DNA invertase Pin-like site-specific DNA recombinase